MLFALALVLVAVLWELYKVIGPQDGGKFFGLRVLPRANDIAMPHVWEMFSRYARPERRGARRSCWSCCGAWFSFRLALTGFVLGTVVGVAWPR